MKSERKIYADVSGLITMLLVACEDDEINATLKHVLSQPNHRRQTFLKKLLLTLREKKAPADLIEAMACLIDDTVAEQAYVEIYRCKR